MVLEWQWCWWCISAASQSISLSPPIVPLFFPLFCVFLFSLQEKLVYPLLFSTPSYLSLSSSLSHVNTSHFHLPLAL